MTCSSCTKTYFFVILIYFKPLTVKTLASFIDIRITVLAGKSIHVCIV